MDYLKKFLENCESWPSINWSERDAFFRVLERKRETGGFDPVEIGRFFKQAWRERRGHINPEQCELVASYYENLAKVVERYHQDEDLIAYRRHVQESDHGQTGNDSGVSVS